MSDTLTPVNAGSLSRRLKARGIPTGYRYTQSGYTQHDHESVTEPGVMISRKVRDRYSGEVDGGGVFIYTIGSAYGADAPEEFVDAVEAALTDAGYVFTRKPSGTFDVMDEDNQPRKAPEPNPENAAIARATADLLALLDQVIPSTTAHYAVEDARAALRTLNRIAGEGTIKTVGPADRNP